MEYSYQIRRTREKRQMYMIILIQIRGGQFDRKNIVGYLFMIGEASISLNWKNKQWIIVVSSIEAGYVAAFYLASETSWIEMMLEVLNASEVEDWIL